VSSETRATIWTFNLTQECLILNFKRIDDGLFSLTGQRKKKSESQFS
jgi:hypothetical protein